MDWSIHHVNVPSSTVRRCAAFLSETLGLIEGSWTYPADHGELHHDRDSIVYFGVANEGLHVVRVIAEFAHDHGFLHNPTVGGHVALNVADLRTVRSRLAAAGVKVTDAGTYAMDGVHQTYAFDPSGNLVEINATVCPLHSRALATQDPTAAVRITAVVKPSHDLDRDSRFYADIVGLGPATPVEGEGVRGIFFNATNGQRLILATPDAVSRLDPALFGAFVVATPSLKLVAERLRRQSCLIERRDQGDLLGEPALYTLTPSGRLVGLVERWTAG